MARAHKNKTFATLLASVLGGIGAHRFYLFGKKDFWAWAHFLTLPVSLLALATGSTQPTMLLSIFFILSILSGFLEALVIGVTPDEKWDVRHNPDSGKQSDSGWPVAALLVLTMGIGTTALIATLARAFDLFFTGGAYG
jgi:hypothetical protein